MSLNLHVVHGGDLGKVPIRRIGLPQQGHKIGLSVAVEGSGSGGRQSSKARMRWRLALAAAASQP